MPTLATVVCMLFIFCLFWTDLRRPDSPSKALWIPLVWMFLAGSRFASQWLHLGPPATPSANDYAEGSPIDAAVFFALIMAGILILAKRKIDWQKLLRNNIWIFLYLLYCLASMTWSDEPTLLMKRWVKDLGNPIMALVILTERRPYEAVGVVLRRLAFLLLPLSVLFIKYYPELGRDYAVSGAPMFTGVGRQKNDLGLMCLLAGIYVFWELLQRRRPRRLGRAHPVHGNAQLRGFTSGGFRGFTRSLGRRVRALGAARGNSHPGFMQQHKIIMQQHKIIAVVMIGMLAWLLHMSDSQTSFVCLVAAVLVLLLGRMPFLARRPAMMFGGLLCVVVAFALADMLDLKELALSFVGRNPTLTNRTVIWQTLETFEVNPIVGFGFMSFWTGERLEKVWRLFGTINQAHNGYLEQYLNLGYIGVAFIVLIVLSGLLRVRRHLSDDPAAGMLRLCFIVTALLYNYSEASFYGINNMWILLLLGCLEVPRRRQSRTVDVNPSKQRMVQGTAGVRYQRWPPTFPWRATRL
jgi:exopolysaccharide production protein ExoQ